MIMELWSDGATRASQGDREGRPYIFTLSFLNV